MATSLRGMEKQQSVVDNEPKRLEKAVGSVQ